MGLRVAGQCIILDNRRTAWREIKIVRVRILGESKGEIEIRIGGLTNRISLAFKPNDLFGHTSKQTYRVKEETF